ncbi:MAG TPA: energy transducer TonB, partial [Pyrinomonadaceae bacterium]|nr:energy transducer TonB [Pyrinomonadaceae bacterium]
PVDYSRPFRTSELSRRARLTSKPEPAYTEAARKFHVQGTVTVRAVLGSSGAVERVGVVNGLPHGLTARAVEAARAIKFEPAEKDGRKVAQWVTIQYNFHIY